MHSCNPNPHQNETKTNSILPYNRFKWDSSALDAGIQNAAKPLGFVALDTRVLCPSMTL